MYAVEIGMGSGLRAGFFTHKLLWSGVGLALGAALLFFDYRRLRRYSSVLYVAALVVPALVDELGLVPHLQQRLINYTPILFAVALAGIVIWNLLMTVGLLPVAGVDLPFISYGMQGAVQLALVGLVLGVFRQKEIIRSPALPQ